MMHSFFMGFLDELDKTAGLPSHMKAKLRSARKAAKAGKTVPKPKLDPYSAKKLEMHQAGREAAYGVGKKNVTVQQQSQANIAKGKQLKTELPTTPYGPMPKPSFKESKMVKMSPTAPVVRKPVAPTQPVTPPKPGMGKYVAGGALALGTMAALQSGRERA